MKRPSGRVEGITKRNQRIADEVGDRLFDQSEQLLAETQPEAWYGDAKTPEEQLRIAHVILTDYTAMAEMRARYDQGDRITDPLRVSKRWVRDLQEMVRLCNKEGLDLTPIEPEPAAEEVIEPDIGEIPPPDMEAPAEVTPEAAAAMAAEPETIAPAELGQ